MPFWQRAWPPPVPGSPPLVPSIRAAWADRARYCATLTPLEEAVEWGAAHGILVQETPGDTTMVTHAMVEAEVKRGKKGGGVSALR